MYYNGEHGVVDCHQRIHQRFKSWKFRLEIDAARSSQPVLTRAKRGKFYFGQKKCRSSELLSLTWNHFYLQENIIAVSFANIRDHHFLIHLGTRFDRNRELYLFENAQEYTLVRIPGWLLRWWIKVITSLLSSLHQLRKRTSRMK